MTSNYFSFQNRQIHYRVTGTGRPAILLHGFGEDSQIWDGQAVYLSARHRLIMPDLPGSGRSELLEDMSLEGMADMLASLLALECGHPASASEKPALIGHSMGGYISLAFVERFPERLRAFGLFHSTAYADSEAKKETRAKGIAFTREHGAPAFLKTVIPNLFSPKSRQEKPEIIRELIERVHNFSDTAVVLYYQSMMARPDRRQLLTQTTLPVLFVIGSADAAVPASETLEQTHLPGISYIHVLSQSGHMAMLEEPEKANQILDEFLLDT